MNVPPFVPVLVLNGNNLEPRLKLLPIDSFGRVDAYRPSDDYPVPDRHKTRFVLRTLVVGGDVWFTVPATNRPPGDPPSLTFESVEAAMFGVAQGVDRMYPPVSDIGLPYLRHRVREVLDFVQVAR